MLRMLMHDVPLPLSSGRIQCRQIVFEQIQTHALYVMVTIVDPVHVLHIKIEQPAIGRVQPLPQLLHIVVAEHPFVGAEKRYDIGEFVDFLVDLK